MELSVIRDNVIRVIETASETAVKSGRRGEDITIVAATKMNPPENIQAAIKAGIKNTGENRVQEFLDKLPQGAYSGASIHFIGHLQKNKAKFITGQASLIHSVDSPQLLSTISRLAQAKGIVQDVLLQVNIGREDSKSGVLPEALDELAASAAQLDGVRVRGLMAIPPVFTKESKFNYFDEMYKLFVDIRDKKYDNNDMCFLSMGMSGDYPFAIMAGSNMIRIGTAIFGPRNYF